MKTLPFSSTARATGKRLSNKHISDHCLPISAFHTPIVEKKSKKVKARRPGGVTRPIFRNTDWRGYTYTHISSFYESDMPNFTLFFISVFSALFIYFFLHLGPIFSVVYFFNDWTPIVLLRGGARTLAGYCPGNVVKKRERERVRVKSDRPETFQFRIGTARRCVPSTARQRLRDAHGNLGSVSPPHTPTCRHWFNECDNPTLF